MKTLRSFGIPFGFSALIAALVATISSPAWASFVAYSSETTWQGAAGTTVLEDFESYSAGAQISNLPGLGVEFEVLAGGGFPMTTLFGGPSHGPMQLSNFPNGINAINQYDDIVLTVLSGYQITAVGFWNGDGQADTLTATVYDASNNVLGSVGAFKDTFAGFTSSTPVARVVFGGVTGDGWNHLDGLQTNATLIPEPSTLLLLATGLLLLIPRAR